MQMKKRVKVAIKVIEDNLPQVYQNQISNRNFGREKRMKTPNNPIAARTHIETTFITGVSPDNLLSVPRTTDAPSRNKWLSNQPSPRENKPWQTSGRYSQSQATFEDIILQKQKIEWLVENKNSRLIDRESVIEEKMRKKEKKWKEFTKRVKKQTEERNKVFQDYMSEIMTKN